MFRAVIVAAGLGRRLGADKALVELGDATIAERVVAAYRAARFDEVVVVRRAGAAALPSGLDARVVECEPPEMIDSVRAGLDGLPRERDSWAFVHPVDYALAADGVLAAMRAACVTRGVRIVTPECGGRRGHPIALHASLVDEVADPSVTTSLRDVLRRDEGRVATVDVTNPWIRRDIDEPDDLAVARAFLARPRGPTTNVMRAHRSRRRYAAHDVPDRQLEWLVDSARHAATSSLMQAYAVVAVRDAAQRERIAALCSDQAHVREAPVFLAVCADLHKIGVACDRHGGELQSGSLEVFLQAVIDAAIAAEILGEPVIDRGHGQPIRPEPERPVVIDEFPRRTVELGVHNCRRVGVAAQVRTADRGAVDGVVDAGITEDRAQDPMLDIVQGQIDAFDHDCLRIPRPEGKEARRDVDVENAVQRIMVDHDLQRHGVVEIDPECHRFRFFHLRRTQCGEPGNVIQKIAAALCGQSAIVHAIDAVRGGGDETLQQVVQRRVIDGRGPGLRLGDPAFPEIGLGSSRQRRGQQEQQGQQPEDLHVPHVPMDAAGRNA